MISKKFFPNIFIHERFREVRQALGQELVEPLSRIIPRYRYALHFPPP